MLTPQKAAALLQNVCETVPLWEYGALGSDNALRLTAQALQQGGEVAEQGARLALVAWQLDPLDARLARTVQALLPDGPWQAMTQALAAWCREPEDAEADAQIWAQADASELPRLLERVLADPQHGGYGLRQAFAWCLARPEGGELLQKILPLLADSAPEPVRALAAPLAARLWAQWAVVHMPASQALDLCTQAMPAFALWRDLREAQCLLALGQREAALPLLHRVWAHCPCHPNLLLCLYDAAFPAALPAEAALPLLALYSWNKAHILRNTLLSLRATEGAQAPVLVLDNGSSDGTADMLRHMAEEWPRRGERPGLQWLSLPVNVGAPAARNWLLSLPEVRERGDVLFLDDDLLLTPGWLDTLRAAAHSHPQAAVLGCRIVDHTLPHAQQCGDFFLLPPDMGQRSFLDLEEHVFVHGNSMGSTDNLLTGYTRPCVSVSGCCHWLRPGRGQGQRQGQGSLPPFDVRFNPSQFDDLERDMRLTLAGEDIVYVGQARIQHVQHSSLRQAVTRARSAHIFGNKIKLEYLHSAADTAKIREAGLSKARRDLLRKITRLTSWRPA